LNFFKIYGSLSPIVTMLNSVIWELRLFLTFYFILILHFALMFSVLGVGNWNLRGLFRDTFFVKETEQACENNVIVDRVVGLERELQKDAPGYEYKSIGMFFGNIFMLIRLSMGDTEVLASSIYLTEAEQWLFWVMLILSLVLFNFIMMNYIIADASQVYTDVS
jgi:hypothetical protein